MKNLWQQVREFLPIAALIMLCLVIVPTAQANSNNNGSTITNTATQNTSTQTADAPDGTKAAKAKSKTATTKPASKSVLDEEVLDSPISYFWNAFSSQEDGADAMPSSSPEMVTLKALIATLLSTIL